MLETLQSSSVETLGGYGTVSTPTREREDELHPGTRMGRYLVRGRLGSGAMGVVYSALDTQLEREVALKVARNRPENERDAQRLLHESRCLARVRHCRVVTVHDAGTTEGGDVYVALERLDGMTFRHWLATPRPPLHTRRALATAGRGLLATHRANLIHRDFKPDNVMIDDAGNATLLDYGIALVTSGIRGERGACKPISSAPLAVTRGGTVMGTPVYMAPEQYFDGSASVWSDQFSFCVSAWEAVYGFRPFAGSDMGEIMRRVLDGDTRPTTPARGVDLDLHMCLLRGLAARPESRWPSLEPIIEVLERTPRVRRRPTALAGELESNL